MPELALTHLLARAFGASRSLVVVVGAGLALNSVAGPLAALPPAESGAPAEFKHLKFRSIGPAAGGRCCRGAGAPGNPLVWYATTAAGGIWKSTDGGLSWKPIFDNQPDSSVGSIAVAQSNPNVVYAGAGEANIRGDVVTGHGIYKSTDAGKTWKRVWKQEGQIGTMAVHPTNPDIAYAAVLGHAFGPNPERGVYRTRDGGKTWERVLYKDDKTGASDLSIDPTNPQVVFAGLWQARRRPWELTSGGPGGGLHVSRDGGETWTQLGPRSQVKLGEKAEAKPEADEGDEGPGKGLPKGPWGKIGVAVAPSDGRRIYALIEAEKGGLFRSDDGGDSWRLVNPDQRLRQRAWYYSTLTVDPKNPDIVWFPQVSLLKTSDGGKTLQVVRGPHHGDHHDVWIDPLLPRRMINLNDGGVDLSESAGESWTSPPLPISQFYHVAADNQQPYHVSGAMQDLGTASGPSNSLAGGIAISDWHSVGGGEAGFTAPDPGNPDIVYAGEYGGYISKYNHKTREVQNISVYPYSAVGHGGSELRYRFQWTAPILVSPHDHKVVYHGGNVLFKTSDQGLHWQPISPDLTRDDKSKEQWSGGPITGDNTGAEIYCTIFAIAESPRQKDLLWAGSDDGLVHVTRDGGKHWDNVTKNISGLPEWSTVVCIEPSPFEAATAYLVVDGHKLDDSRPYVWRTTDFGKTWKSLADKLPRDVCLHAVREDPKKKGLLYLGTDRGLMYSADDGADWQPMKLNLPTTPVHDLVVKDNDLVMATHGRSIWIFDDLTPFRAISRLVTGDPVHFLPITDAIRYRYRGGRFGRGAEANPPRGAILHYYLSKKPKGDVTIEVLDEHGSKVTKLSSKPEPRTGGPEEEEMALFRPQRTLLPKQTGVNRAAWDLTYEGPKSIQGAMAWPGSPPSGPMVKPGTYVVKLTVDGQTQRQSVVVRPDPRAKISSEQMDEQLRLALDMRDHVSHLTKMVNQIRGLKKQLAARAEVWKEDDKAEPLVRMDEDLVKKLDALEAKLHNPKAKITYDLLAQKGGAMLYSQLLNVLWTTMESDGPPTQGVREVYEESTSALGRLDAEFQNLVEGDLARLNDTARKLNVPSVALPAGEEKPKKPARQPVAGGSGDD
jgi:photosystem II stability/assembly factor-like uncharacterized protein